MALFGNGFDDPQSAAIMALAGGLLQGNMGAGLLAANQAYGDMGDRRLKRGLLEAQIAETQAQAEARKMAAEKQRTLQDMVSRILAGGDATPAQPGQLGSGSFGVVPAPAGMSDMPTPRPRGIAGADFNQITALHALGGPDLTNAYKFAREGIERKPGSFYEDTQGRREFIPNVEKGIGFRDGRVMALPGYTDFLSATTMATEGPKALLASAGKVNLRKNADGTERPVSEVDENPALRALLAQYMPGGAPAAASAPAAPAPMAGRPVIAPAAQKEADAESIRMIQAELHNPQLPADQRPGLQRELARLTASQSQPGFPTPTMARPTPAQGYGKTTEQQTADEVAKTKALEQAKADIRPTQQAKAALDSANYMYNLLDMAIKHPGRETATGLSAVLDPRNYVSGTDAKNFQAIKDQIGGAAFLQAFENLKGGGQITQIEGEKATNAILRMQTSQSDEAFKQALQEFQGVIAKGIERMGGKVPAGRSASGTVGPAVGTVENGYRFVGGNPADRSSWVKQ